ncbi:unnamed protein product, partial [Tetraodon nigroviridis]
LRSRARSSGSCLSTLHTTFCTQNSGKINLYCGIIVNFCVYMSQI